MKNTQTKTKEELLEIVADISPYSYRNLISNEFYVDEDEIQGENDQYIITTEDVRGSEGDGADMFLTISITNKETAEVHYVEFKGRYSSWDSSSYYRAYVVVPYQEMVTFYREVNTEKLK